MDNNFNVSLIDVFRNSDGYITSVNWFAVSTTDSRIVLYMTTSSLPTDERIKFEGATIADVQNWVLSKTTDMQKTFLNNKIKEICDGLHKNMPSLINELPAE